MSQERPAGFIYKGDKRESKAQVGEHTGGVRVRLPLALSEEKRSSTTQPNTNHASSASSKPAPKPLGFRRRLPYPLTKALAYAGAISTRPILETTTRGFNNSNNKCFLNAVLQPMLAAPPFHHFLVSIADTDPSEEYPTVTRFIKLMKEYYQHSSKASSQAVAPQTVQRGVWSVPVAQTRAASSFTPDMFYDLLKRFNPIGSGWQEDSQEFLCFLLDSLHNELVAAQSLSSMKQQTRTSFGEDPEDWEQVGKKNKSAVVITEESRFKETKITEIFGGKMRSVVRKKGLKASASIEPFFSLPLDINSDEVTTIQDALRLYLTTEKLSDYTANNQTVQASKEITIDVLPRIMTLHLKRFEYTLYGIEKIHKAVDFGLELKIQPSWLANEKAYTPAQRTYKLFAVISHWGKTGIGGHYTCDVLQPNGDWLHFDDASVSKVTLDTVLHRPAYLLMYIMQS